jgi:undecaprenyl-diphosphatase
MTLFHAFLLGIIEGLTEFIPVSSTAHMLIVERLLNISPTDAIVVPFLILVQIGPLVALVIYFWKDLWEILKAFFAKPFSTFENKLAWFIIIATIPALIFGYLLRDVVKALLGNPLEEAAIRLLITAAVLVLAEWLGKRNRSLEKMTWLDALIVGLAQVIAVFPGASRSGTTISGGMARGLDRPSATRFAFLMSVPVMAASAGYETLSVLRAHVLSSLLAPLAIGFVVAAIVGWFAVKWLLGYLGKHSLYAFAIYCAVVGATCLVFALIKLPL